MRRVLAVALLLLLAGCTGVFGGDAQREAPSVTPVPVPEPTPGRVVVPQAADGTPAVGRLIAAHSQALSTRPFHLRVVRSDTSAVDVWVDHEADLARFRRVVDESVTDVVVHNGTRYEVGADGEVRSSPVNDLPFVDSPTGFFLLQQRVAGLVYTRAGTATRDGRRVALLRANTTNSTISRSGFRTVVAANSTLAVDRNGIVRELDHEERYADGTVRRLRLTVTTGEDVPLPEWYERQESERDDR